MTTLFRKCAAATLVLAWFCLPSIANAAACSTSLASLQGWYAMLITGTNAANSSNKYFTGAVLFDGAGNLSGSNIYSGTGTDSAVTGTYTLNSDCSLTLNMTIGSGNAQQFMVGVRSSTNEAVGVEVDASAVATIDLQAQYSTYTPGLNFTSSSANGTFAANCINLLTNASDLNLATFANGTITGTAAYNSGGVFATANTPDSGTYRVNSDGTIVGSASINGTPYGVYGVLSNANAKIKYLYTTTSGSPYAACSGALVPAATSPSFSLAAAGATLSVAQGASGSDAISVTGTNGFSGSVSFSASGLPAGASAAFSPATSATGTTLTLTTASSTPSGSYAITISGTSGSLTATTSVRLTVTGSTTAFSLTPSAATLTLPQNVGGTDVITVIPANGFTGSVSLAVSGLPSGSSGGFSGTTLVVFPSISTAVGTYPLTITGTSGSATASTVVKLVITAGASFTLSPSASSVSVAPGNSVSDAIGVTGVNGFSSSVSFSASGLPTGVSAAFSPASSSSGTTLTLTTAATTATGSYPILITGTTSGSGSSNGLKQTATVTLVVASASTPGFTLSAASGALTLAQGVSGSDAITVTPVNGFTGAVSLSVSGLPSGATGTFSGTTLTIVASASTAVGSYRLTITGKSGTTTASTTVNLVITAAPSFTLSPSAGSVSVIAGKSVSDAITVNGSNGFNAAVSFSASGLPAGVTAAFSPASSASGTSLALTTTSTTVAGSYPIVISGTSKGIKQTVTVTLVVASASTPGFTLSAASGTLTLAQNVAGTDVITVTAIDGFKGSVSLAVSGLPSGATGAFSGTTLAIFPSTATAVGSYRLTITGKSGSTTASTTVNLVVTAGASFTLSTSAGSISVTPGKSVSDVISVIGSNGFNAAVSFSASGLPTGVTAAFSPASSSSGTTLTLTTKSTTVAGSYSILISGTPSGAGSSNGHTQTATVTMVVASSTAPPGFTLSPVSATLTLARNASGSDGITVTPVNGFTGTVSFSVSGLPSGTTGTFSGTTLMIVPSASTALGSHKLTITGKSGSISASTTLNLVITAAVSFTLSPDVASVSVIPGKLVIDAINVTGANGFNAAVTFSASGLPAGATAAFSPASSSSGTTLTLTTKATAIAGSYPIVISGTSQGTTQTATVTLVVAASSTPGFTLSPASGTLTLPQNGSGSEGIVVTPVNGFTGVVVLGVSGLPSGATSGFLCDTLLVTVPAGTATGTYPLEITGTSGTKTTTTTLNLVVTGLK